MLFAGPTGLGKTETAKIIAKYFCGSENYLIKINMGEFTNDSDITKLIGLLFDEAEKAHSSIFDAVLNILDSGEMADNYANRISFRSAIIILTCNLVFGGRYFEPDVIASFTTENERVHDAVINHFRPEIINRLSGRVTDVLIERYRNQYIEMLDSAPKDFTFSMKETK